MPDINFKPRLYQETILDSCLRGNTLVVLPTGMGKTKIAILAIVKRLSDHKSSKALFLTPTKPLANQIYTEIKESTTADNVTLFTGTVPPSKRKDLWETSNIIVSTPQCIENDLLNKSIDISTVSTLIIDEAHRAVQEYAYTWIAKEYHKKSKFERLVGLTASPGSNKEKILEVCKNLYTKKIESRTEEDPDVKEYTQELNIEKEIIELPDEFKKIKKLMENSLKEKITNIKKQGTLKLSSQPSKKELLNAQGSLQGELARGAKDYGIYRSISLVAETIKINHAIEMLETQGINSLQKYLKTIFEDSKNKSKAVKNLTNDLNFKSAYILAKELESKKVKHPKQERLIEIVKQNIKEDPSTKIIIFNNYRDSAKELETELNKIKEIEAKLFVGQAKKDGIKLNQKEQVAIIKDFENSIYNCLVSTSIGEEGLDIPRVDLVIFYEPIPSAIRSIQRRGRTARHDKGRIILLITKNTRDEINYWISHHKEKRMHSALQSINKKLGFERQPTLKTFMDKTGSIIHVDSRESNSGITKKLHDLGINIKLKPLTTADFIVSERVGIERKTTRDFVDSLIDKRIFSQIRNLRNNFEKPIVIIEGTEDIYSLRKIHPNAIRGMLSAIAISYGVPILHTKSPQDTAELLKVISIREQNPDAKEISLRLEKKPTTTKEQQEFIIESLPGIGPSTAKTLLKNINSIKEIANSKKEDLEKIEGIGKKRAEEIERIVNEIYES